MGERFMLMMMLTGGIWTAGAAGEKNQPVRDTAVVTTSLGTFEIELYRQDAPKTVANFVGLAKKKFFDGLRIHRVAPGFVLQTGDPLSRDLKAMPRWGSGGKSIYGREFEDELDPATPSAKIGYKRGTVAMANHGPNTNSSQFFVLLGDAPWLPHSYTIFGRVIAGLETIDRIGAVEIVPPGGGDGRPKEDLFVTKIVVKGKK